MGEGGGEGVRKRAAHNEHLPKGMRDRHGYYTFLDPRDGKEYGLGRDLRKAIQFAQEAAQAIELSRPSLVDRIKGTGCRPMLRDEYERLLSRAYASVGVRARRDGEAYLTKDELRDLWTRAGGRCQLTGVRFSSERKAGCVKRPWMPSVDRIDSSKGYVAGNCRLVCVAVNLALNEFGDDVLLTIAKGLLHRGHV